MSPTTVPELQQKIFKHLGLTDSGPDKGHGVSRARERCHPAPRKEHRKAHRVQKRTNRYKRQSVPDQTQSKKTHYHVRINSNSADIYSNRTISPQGRNRNSLALMSSDNLQKSESDELEDDDESYSTKNEYTIQKASGSYSNAVPDGAVYVRNMSQSEQAELAKDDAAIAGFEKKLGIKKTRKSLPQSFKDDGLDDLLHEVGSDPKGADDEGRKRKMEYDSFLSSKRVRKDPALSPYPIDDRKHRDGRIEGDTSQVSNLDRNFQGHTQLDISDTESFEGFASDVEGNYQPQRENPYVAPLSTSTTTSKYVPPSLRRDKSVDIETNHHLRKQVQGLINRLTDSNILPIVRSIEELYQTNARGTVTDVISEVLLAQVRKPESLPDQFFVLAGGFSSALYKVVGPSFGSQLVRRVVNYFGDEYEETCNGGSGFRKETSNLLTFLTQLYVFEVVSCKIIFDYMERLLGDLTELNVELLLRICRMAGRLLRRDDPHSLKHVSGVLNAAVSKIGYTNVSPRSKFMIETINDLKNSKPKARGMDSTIVSEHVLRMKKRMSELKSQSRRLDGLAPMGMGVADIEGAESRGKWWLVGASVPAKSDALDMLKGNDNTTANIPEDFSTNEDMDMVLPDYPMKAREQGLNTTTQIAIFTALMSAVSYEQGYRQFLNLRLKRDDQLEIVRVLVQCVGCERVYNPYYSLVAIQVCSNSRVRFAFQDRLWKLFRGLGQSLFGEEAEDEDSADGTRLKDEQRLSNIASFYASLVTEGILTINILKPLDLLELNEWTSRFVECFMVQLLRGCGGSRIKEKMGVDKVFEDLKEFPALAAGMHWFLRNRVRNSKIIETKEMKKLDRVRKTAQEVVIGVVKG